MAIIVAIKLTPDSVDDIPSIIIPATNNVVPALAPFSPPLEE